MEWTTLDFDGVRVRAAALNTAVVGTGAAGWNAALRLGDLGVKDAALVTEGVNRGTSRNAGSDKQTYYKLSLSGDSPDSPAKMAADLFDCRCVDGDIAYAEAALSARCFLRLAELGVPFPVNRYGEYVGYRTDHDPFERASSAGPLTSKLMTECLQREAEKRNLTVLDGLLVVRILKSEGRLCGLLALDLNESAPTRFALLRCKNAIFCTGGPAGVYADTVYPLGHTGSSGVMFEAGAKGKNLTEWQYGLASVRPRWNVSGTYMQALPTFVSVDKDGGEHLFLEDYFGSAERCCSAVFLKGYQWPFDSRRAQSGSSVVDLLVYRETALRGRRAFLDFRRNPFGPAELPFSAMDPEAREYLEKAGACFGTPIERLRHMNEPAAELYRSKGVDIAKERLEIALCAQHCNGGVSTDLWWQTDVPGLFAAGEAAGTHGVRRPGGSALNAGQVGSLRAAQYIARHGTGAPCPPEEFRRAAAPAAAEFSRLCGELSSGGDNVRSLTRAAREACSRSAGAVREPSAFGEMIARDRSLLENFGATVRASSAEGLADAFRLRELLVSQITVLSAMRDYAERGGGSRGSAVWRAEQGVSPEGLREFRFQPDGGELDGQVQETAYSPEGCRSVFRPVRPLPEGGGFFENVWRSFRENGNVY